MSTSDSGCLVDVFDGFSRTWHLAAEMGSNFATGTLYTAFPSALGQDDLLRPPIDRVVFTNRLAFEDSVVVHASAINITGQGVFLFCGGSCIGKSTLADLCVEHAGAKLLNDDRAIVFRDESGVSAGAAPWHGKNPHVDPEPGRLRAIVHLGQSPENRLSSLSEVDSVARLIATSVVPFYYKPALDVLTATCAGICSRVPSYRFEFRPDQSAVATVMSALTVF